MLNTKRGLTLAIGLGILGMIIIQGALYFLLALLWSHPLVLMIILAVLLVASGVWSYRTIQGVFNDDDDEDEGRF